MRYHHRFLFKKKKLISTHHQGSIHPLRYHPRCLVHLQRDLLRGCLHNLKISRQTITIVANLSKGSWSSIDFLSLTITCAIGENLDTVLA